VLDAALALGAPVSARADHDDRALLEGLFHEHYRGFCRLAALMLDDFGAAEEVVQEAFLRTFSSWWRLRQPERAQWYVRSAVVNLCRSRIRRRGSEEAGNRASWRGVEEWGGEALDDAMVVLETVRRLPTRQRETVVLFYYEDLSEADVAATLGCSVGTVKSQLSRARAALARHLDPEAGPPGAPQEEGGDVFAR
jgi:RNA polymerase sigma-70 factor (sigma-E family)